MVLFDGVNCLSECHLFIIESNKNIWFNQYSFGSTGDFIVFYKYIEEGINKKFFQSNKYFMSI